MLYIKHILAFSMPWGTQKGTHVIISLVQKYAIHSKIELS